MNSSLYTPRKWSYESEVPYVNTQFCCMVMRINMDCNGCFRKELISSNGTKTEIRVVLFCMNKELETHLIEKQECRVSVRGKFMPQDVATKIRKKTNRRVEILDIKDFNPSTGIYEHRLLHLNIS
ncbi:hypothetical protein RHGRI_034683 [Rhododendron griersonianum]|uniref:Uncharacterized protein n=1 Tax=Rhododendron griersonianum TaxID=479676 RepID=A0AAV6I2G1_9ERIC|nr:hypothetical protein RHGRI_034683 [Rhododendron griersonianum]